MTTMSRLRRPWGASTSALALGFGGLLFWAALTMGAALWWLPVSVAIRTLQSRFMLPIGKRVNWGGLSFLGDLFVAFGFSAGEFMYSPMRAATEGLFCAIAAYVEGSMFGRLRHRLIWVLASMTSAMASVFIYSEIVVASISYGDNQQLRAWKYSGIVLIAVARLLVSFAIFSLGQRKKFPVEQSPTEGEPDVRC